MPRDTAFAPELDHDTAQHDSGSRYTLFGRRAQTYVDRPFEPAIPTQQLIDNRVVAALRVVGPRARIDTLMRLLSLDRDQVEGTLERLITIGRVEAGPGRTFRLRTAAEAQAAALPALRRPAR